ncbi:MAG: hypothetical protein M3Q19_08885 [Pseudomonadota bacterium]|nr:hypothetical protein [Pseudomonadota bacterium]
MTNGTLVAILGAVTAASTFMIGRYYATRPPEWAAELERKNGGKPYDLAQLHRTGKFMMWNAPILLVIFLGIGLSGMVD